MVEVALGQQEVVLEGSQVGWQLSMDHHQLPQLPSNLHATTAFWCSQRLALLVCMPQLLLDAYSAWDCSSTGVHL